MFALPPGWFPWQVEWVLSFPRAPLGTVSIQVWGGACGTAVTILADAIGYAMALLLGKSLQTSKVEVDAKPGAGSKDAIAVPSSSKKSE